MTQSPLAPLAPKSWPELPAIAGVRLGSVEAGIKYQGRKDLLAISFDQPAAIAGVFTRSKCSSAPVDWCKSNLKNEKVSAIIVNSGNANAFTGKKGTDAVSQTVDAAVEVFNCPGDQVYLASTGVIGEPMDAGDFSQHLQKAREASDGDGWDEAARAIMTTDTYHKMVGVNFEAAGRTWQINGIAKGSGMIAPDMATMLAFLVTDLPLPAAELQDQLTRAIGPTFNSISVDSDTSTSDTVLLAATNTRNSEIEGADREAIIAAFAVALKKALHELAMLVVRDGEGATKHVEIEVRGATNDTSARTIALSIANSPLVKTAVAGEDANWGRIVMAVGKAGEPADRDLLNIGFGDIQVAFKGERDPDYSEAAASAVMKQDFIPIWVDLGLGDGKAKVWTCDLTHGYIDINADYRS